MNKTNSPSFISSSMKKLLTQLENNLNEYDSGVDSTPQFSPICWLSSSETNYVADINSFTILEENTPYTVLVQVLTHKLAAMTEIGGPKPPSVKFILILCELIKLCPIHKTNSDVNIQLTELLNLRLGTTIDLGQYKEIIVDAVDSVVVLSVVAGSNPVPGLLLNQSEKSDVIGLIKSLAIGNHNISAFRCAIGAIVPLLSTLQPEKREEFCILFYEHLGNFFVDHPNQHHEMLALTVNQAQLLIDYILSWYSTPPPYSLPLLCALAPFCTTIAGIGSKGNSFNPIFNALSDFKFKKGNDNTGPAFAYLEIYCAITHTLNAKNKDNFNGLVTFMKKNQDKFEKSIFHMKDKLIVDKLFTDFLPRYAAIDFAVKGTPDFQQQTASLTYLFSLSETGIGWTPISNFFNLISIGYPLMNTSFIIPTNHINQMCQKLTDAYNAIALNVLDKDKIKDAISVSTSISRYLTRYENKTNPLVNVLSDARGDPVKDWTPNPGLKSLLELNKSYLSITELFKATISTIINGNYEVLKSMIPFLMLSWGYKSFWINYSFSDACKIINDISVIFRSHTEEALSKNSYNLTNIPSLFLYFLRWAETILLQNNKKDLHFKLSIDIRSNFIHTLLILHASCGPSLSLEMCESIINQLLISFNYEPIPTYPFSFRNIT